MLGGESLDERRGTQPLAWGTGDGFWFGFGFYHRSRCWFRSGGNGSRFCLRFRSFLDLC